MDSYWKERDVGLHVTPFLSGDLDLDVVNSRDQLQKYKRISGKDITPIRRSDDVQTSQSSRGFSL